MKHPIKFAFLGILALLVLGSYFVAKAKSASDFNKLQLDAKNGNRVDEYNLGVSYQFGMGVIKDEATAFNWYLKSALQSDIEAEAKVCSLYMYGIGITKNDAEAMKWCFKAGAAGNTFGEMMIILAYKFGLHGLKQDRKETVKWELQSANHGVAAAQAGLGYDYANGLGGLTKNYVAADMWATLAAAQNDPKAPKAAAFKTSLEKLMSKEQIAEAKKLASEWKVNNSFNCTP